MAEQSVFGAKGQALIKVLKGRWNRSNVSRGLVLMGFTIALILALGNLGAIAQLTPQWQINIASQKKPVVANPEPTPRQSPSVQFRAIATRNFAPREEMAPADPTNYGERFLVDAAGNPVYNEPIVVLHETVGSAQSAINTFQRRNLRDADQRSYHGLIRRDGTVVYIVAPEYRAFGAGNSVFEGTSGTETVRTNPSFPPSVNNFAYHISFETPSDGRGNQSRHSGYTRAQYQSMAWLTARTGVPRERITTHQSVDRSGSRRDPRSFDSALFFSLWQDFVTQMNG